MGTTAKTALDSVDEAAAHHPVTKPMDGVPVLPAGSLLFANKVGCAEGQRVPEPVTCDPDR